MIRRITHVGLMVKDIEAVESIWTDVFGLQPWAFGVWHAVEEGVMTLMLPVGDSGSIELLHPTDPSTPFQKALDAGRGLFHISLRVANLDALVQRLREHELWVRVRPAGEVLPLRRGWVDPTSACGAHIELIDEGEVQALTLPPADSPAASGIFARFSHVGHLVANLEASLHLYRDAFGLAPEAEVPTRWPEEGVVALRFPVGDGPALEVIQITDTSSMLGRHYQQYGEGLAYLGMDVRDLDEAVDAVSARDVWLQVRPAGDSLPRRAWIHPRSTGGALLRLTAAR